MIAFIGLVRLEMQSHKGRTQFLRSRDALDRPSCWHLGIELAWMPWHASANPKRRRPAERTFQIEPRFTAPHAQHKQVPRVARRFIVNEAPDIKSHQGRRKEAKRNVQRPIHAGGVQDAKQPDKQTSTNHEQHDRSTLEDPDTGPAFSCIVVSMHMEGQELVDGLNLEVGLRPAGGEHGLRYHPSKAANGRDNQRGFNASHMPFAQR